MPYAMVAPIIPADSTAAPRRAEPAHVHAAFLDLVRRCDPDLAERLHSDTSRKPFCIWMFAASTPDSQRPTQALRITLLDDSLFAPIVASIVRNPGMTLRLGQNHFSITEIATHPAAHHLAGYATFANLAADTAAPSRITVRFVSPTVFRSQGRDVLWPDPRLVWQSWLRSWNEHCDESLRLDEARVIEQLLPTVQIRSHEARTRRLHVADGVVAGFVGQAEYDLSGAPPDLRRILATLARYAFYCGTGRKTTMGLGQTRPLHLA